MVIFACAVNHFSPFAFFRQKREMVKVDILIDKDIKTIHNFAASDAWAAQ